MTPRDSKGRRPTAGVDDEVTDEAVAGVAADEPAAEGAATVVESTGKGIGGDAPEASEPMLPGPDAELAATDDEIEHAASSRSPSATRPNALLRLYRGETAFDFIGNRRWWFVISAVVILAGILSMGTRGLNLGIDFKGGQSWSVSSQTLTVGRATTVVKAAGLSQPTVVELTNLSNHTKTIEVQADLNSKPLAVRQQIENQVQAALAKAAGVTSNAVSINDVGPTWGGQVTSRAVEALIIFFIAVVAYISIRFEFKMAVAALIAVIHDILVTAGIYSLTGFQVTPDTVIAVLTVLGYSLYDTVVVFDRIGENAKGLGASGRISYSDMVNLSMNQTLARSINTSLVAIMPVLSVLVVGSFILGATTLQNFGLALVIGLTSGAYSSIFIASPLLAMMKEREPRYTTIRQRLETRGDRMGILTPSAAAAMAGAGSVGGTRSGGRQRTPTSGVIRPGAGAPARKRSAADANRSPGGGSARAGGATATKEPAVTTSPEASTAPASGAARPSANRPPPRPRKAKGKGGKGKRR